MSPETQEKLERVKKYSASLTMFFLFVWFVFAFAGVIGLIIILTINNGQRPPSTLEFGNVLYTGEEITWAVKIAAAIGWALTVLIALKLIGHLGALFKLYSKGQIFTSDNVKQIREIGVSVFLFMGVWIYGMVSRVLVGFPGNGTGIETPGMHVRGWGFGLPEPVTVTLAGIIIVVISWIMDVGRELREEQDLTV